MARKKRWIQKDIKHGFRIIELLSWKYFHDFITQKMLDYSHYVWRGDRRPSRPLLPSFELHYKDQTRSYIERRLRQHLQIFKEATRGRRGLHPPSLGAENDWWSLGQHFGLNTPLLDWTHSPFVALFFAFAEAKKPQPRKRAVYAINPISCKFRNDEIKNQHKGRSRPDIVEFFSPQQDENSRLVSQGGLFSRCTAGKPIDRWVRKYFEGYSTGAVLLKILIPDTGRLECLRTLNKMNVNYLSLFPDLYGASSHANTVHLISRY